MSDNEEGETKNESQEEEEEASASNAATASEEDQSLTMPTDDGDDQFETIQQEFQEVLQQINHNSAEPKIK